MTTRTELVLPADDWAVCELPDVHAVIRGVARKVARECRDLAVFDSSDLEQIAHELVATNADRVRADHAAGGAPYVGAWLAGKLSDAIRTEQRRGQRWPVAQYREDSEITDDEREAGVVEPDCRAVEHPLLASATYSERLVEFLLPGLFDEAAAYGLRNPLTADADMPKHPRGSRQDGALWAHLADVRRAWELARLTHLERRTVFMRHVLDWTVTNIAAHEGVGSSVISRRDAAAVGKLTRWLNGLSTVATISSSSFPTECHEALAS